MSSLSRIAVDNHRMLSIEEYDTVVLSARIIPGNEKAIFRMIDHFFRRRVLVYYEGGRSAPIHVSGHASQEEMKIVLKLVRPKYFVPLHGEYRQFFRHAALAEQVGAVSGQIFLLESGHPIEFTPDRFAHIRASRCPRAACSWIPDRSRKFEDVVIRERRHWRRMAWWFRSLQSTSTRDCWKSSAGDCFARICADRRRTGIACQGPRSDSADGGTVDAQEKTDWGVIKEKIRVDLKRFLNKQTSKRPLILPVILEI